MKLYSKSLISLLLLFVLISIPAFSQEEDSARTIEYPLVPLEALEDALAGIKMTPADLSFRTDYVELDPFRLAVIDSLTLHPLWMPEFMQKLADFFLDSNTAIHTIIPTLSAWINYDSYPHQLDLGIFQPLFQGLDNTTQIKVPEIGYPDGISRGDTISIDLIVNRCFGFLEPLYLDEILRETETYNGLVAAEISFLRDSFPLLILEDVEDEFKPIGELDSLQKYEEELSKRAIPICQKLDLNLIFGAHEHALVSLDGLNKELNSLIPEIREDMDSRDWLIEEKTPFGKIAIGGWGRNQYEGEYYFILDLGGDDIYQLDKAEATQIIIDYTGNDTYIAREDYCLASGNFGLGILIDKEGDDLYNAKNFSLGSGLFGVGILLDESGHDIYIGDTHSQGAATFGIGLLIDRGGNDDYRCALFGQAFAGPGGFGSIIDFNGNDNYFAGGKYKDFLRYEDHFLSLSQGFAFGYRPRMSGGVALLIDSTGNDIYTSDIFGQGGSYWYALGGLYDIAGSDKYLSFQYAQGNATHLTLGILMDKSGDDYYFSKGVSQGCGHDLAAGLLIDYAGNDTYQAYDLSQAAGSANGVGILIDYLGNDTYEIKSTKNTQGYGNPRRDYGSIGLFMDLMGEDHYIGNGQDNLYWIIESKWGIGMDIDFWEKER
jgi:hypothetical protein